MINNKIMYAFLENIILELADDNHHNNKQSISYVD